MTQFAKHLAPASLALIGLAVACGGSSKPDTTSINGRYSAVNSVTCDGKELPHGENDERDSTVIANGMIQSTTYKTSAGSAHTCYLLDTQKITSLSQEKGTLEIETLSAEEVCVNDKNEEVSRVDYLAKSSSEERAAQTFNFRLSPSGELFLSQVVPAAAASGRCKSGQVLTTGYQRATVQKN